MATTLLNSCILRTYSDAVNISKQKCSYKPESSPLKESAQPSKKAISDFVNRLKHTLESILKDDNDDDDSIYKKLEIEADIIGKWTYIPIVEITDAGIIRMLTDRLVKENSPTPVRLGILTIFEKLSFTNSATSLKNDVLDVIISSIDPHTVQTLEMMIIITVINNILVSTHHDYHMSPGNVRLMCPKIQTWICQVLARKENVTISGVTCILSFMYTVCLHPLDNKHLAEIADELLGNVIPYIRINNMKLQASFFKLMIYFAEHITSSLFSRLWESGSNLKWIIKESLTNPSAKFTIAVYMMLIDIVYAAGGDGKIDKYLLNNEEELNIMDYLFNNNNNIKSDDESNDMITRKVLPYVLLSNLVCTSTGVSEFFKHDFHQKCIEELVNFEHEEIVYHVIWVLHNVCESCTDEEFKLLLEMEIISHILSSKDKISELLKQQEQDESKVTLNAVKAMVAAVLYGKIIPRYVENIDLYKDIPLDMKLVKKLDLPRFYSELNKQGAEFFKTVADYGGDHHRITTENVINLLDKIDDVLQLNK